ncbi:MAG: DUF1553 domain-containing protein [Pedosphaera sp.]|nr:DUF1553 domain-containing protein [Pedosphaera sp.]
MNRGLFMPVLVLAFSAGTVPFSSMAAGAGDEFFETKIRPVLAEHCFECHSASARKLKGGLRLDGRKELLAGGETGPAIVPGQPETSLLIRAMAHRDKDLAMPPKKPKLPDAVIADFERWIREGAVWPATETASPKPKIGDFNLDQRKKKQAWLWEAPRRQAAPTVKNSRWPLGTEDRFILRRLEDAEITPAPAADDRTWLRRVHFVITGLPPGREEIQAFLADTKPGARERVADQLLASPHFGERWARHWMDLMRYAESRGHESDYIIANAWHYRDYLIRAFNDGVPYDQFLSEHLAGDLLPVPRLRPGTEINESVLGTGWAFLGEEIHSPVDIRQDECERIDNKVDVFSKTFLGLTVACARCHDHKFDPIRAQDYYALSGFMLGSSFRQVRFEAMENNRKMAGELAALRERFVLGLAKAVAASNERGLGQTADYLLAAREVLLAEKQNASTVSAEAARKNSLDSSRLQRWGELLGAAAANPASPLHSLAKVVLHPDSVVPGRFVDLLAAHRQARPAGLPTGARVVADFTRPDQQPWKVDGEAFGPRPLRPGDIIAGNNPTNPIARVMTYGAARRDLFWNHLKSAPGNQNDSGTLAATARSGQMLRTPTVTLGVGRLHYLIRGKAKVYAAVDSHLMVDGPLHARLVQTFDGGAKPEPRWVTHDLSPYSGHRTHVEFGPEGTGELEVLMVVESAEVPKWQPGAAFEPSASARSSSDYAKEFQNALVAANRHLGRGTLANSPESARDAALANWLVQNPTLSGALPDVATLVMAGEFLAAQSNLASRVRWESQTAVAWFDGTGVDENILVRGKPFQPGAVSPRSLPAVFAPAKTITTASSSGRYELARQLVDPANPLVARTIVNRVWHHVYGRGLVASVDNFGALGDRPSHPELLDHLAWQLVHEDHWSLQRLIKRLVLTRTFAMSSHAAEARAEELDPSNTLLHRMPVRRLEAEAIRDSLLAVSGRLNRTVYGPPVPVHLTEFIVGRGRPEQSGPLDGDGRRSVYAGMRRNFLSTLMQTFDAPTPFSTVGRRNVTNVPAQSLALMNDPLFHQQAGVWTERLLRETREADAAARVRWLFESAYGRLPADQEIAACLESLRDLRQLHNTTDGQSTAVWGDLCHALLNANEFIYVK